MYNVTGFSERSVNTAFRRLMSDDLAPVIQFLKDYLAEKADTLKRAHDPIEIYRVQGQISAVENILETAAKAVHS